MPVDAYFRGLFQMVARPVSEFLQAEHTGDTTKYVLDEKNPTRKWAVPDQTRALVKGGFCHGASLDWLRKVIQREDAARYTITHRKWSRVSRMVDTHLQEKVARPAARDAVGARADAEIAAATDARTAALEQAKRLLIDWAEGNGCTVALDANGGIKSIQPSTAEIGAMIDAKFAEYDEMKKQARARASEKFAASNAKVKAFNEATPGQELGILWSDIARQLGTDAGKTRKFSGMIPAAGSASSNYADLKSFLIEAVAAPAFIPGRGILLSFDFVPEPGHTIAAHRESADNYVLFDPNLGVFRCKSLEKFVIALVVLIEECYLAPAPKETKTSLGSSHYWHVFCRTGGFVPGTAKTNSSGIDEARLGYDGAAAARDSYATTSRFVAEDALTEAKRLRAEYQKAKGPATQRAWVDAHNEAVVAVRRSRIPLDEAKREYSEYDGTTITLGPG
jgi:hypothetical protein